MHLENENLEKRDLLSIGNMAFDHFVDVERLPNRGLPRRIIGERIYFGGRAGNVAFHCAQLGLRVSINSVVGSDFLESGYKSHLEEQEIDTRGIEVVLGARSPAMFIIKDAQGQTKCIFKPNIQHKSGGPSLTRSDLMRFRTVFITPFNSEKSFVSLLSLIESSEGGKNVFLNLGMEIEKYSLESILLAIRASSYVSLNYSELTLLLRKIKTSSATELVKNFTSLRGLAVTLGESGSIVYTQEDRFRIPAIYLPNPATAIGAGDSYISGFIWGLQKNLPIKQCARIASIVSSMIIAKEGARTAVISPNTVLREYNSIFKENL
jgi:sugar/nucleoside kinase (ribokinase family)